MTVSADQIVVATEHRERVLAEIDGQGKVADTLPRLGLTLVDLLADAGQLADGLLAEVPEDARDALVRRHGADAGGLDRLLTYLRGAFEARSAGWAPTLGKNRTLSGIQFLPYASAGGFDVPVPVDLPPRPAPGEAPLGELPRRVRVGLLDTQVVPHPFIDGRYFASAAGIDPGPLDGEPREGWRGHATFISDIVLRRATTAELEARTAVRWEPAAEGGPTWTMPLWRFAQRLVEFEDAGVQVLNLSVGLSTADGKPPLVLERAVNRLADGLIVVAAAGNHGTSSLTDEERAARGMPEQRAALFPAALDGVVAVGALDDSGAPAEFNPRGGADGGVAEWIDVFAPGTAEGAYLGTPQPEQVSLPLADGTTFQQQFSGAARWTGTSFAAAGITGEIAARLAAGDSREAAVAHVRDQYRR